MAGGETCRALLSCDGGYTRFEFAGHTIRFRTSLSLSRYTEVREWDGGYLVVMAQYGSDAPEEEYIDLVPILRNLYFDPAEFCTPIKGVDLV